MPKGWAARANPVLLPLAFGKIIVVDTFAGAALQVAPILQDTAAAGYTLYKAVADKLVGTALVNVPFTDPEIKIMRMRFGGAGAFLLRHGIEA